MNRRTSYASVAAGTAAATDHPPPFTTEDTAMAASAPPRTQELLPPSGSRTYLADALAHTQDVDRPRGILKKPDSYTIQYNALGDLTMDGERLITPSYLRSSRYIERLNEVRKARLQGLKDTQRQSQHTGLGSRTGSWTNLAAYKNVHPSRTPVQDVIERIPAPSTSDNLRPLPSRWNEQDKCSGLEILGDGTEVRFQGVSRTPDDAAAVRSDQPMPKECGIYYFEVTILSRGKEGLIGIGFSGAKPNLNRLPGWESESWGYHGDDGFSFACSATGRPYGPKFSALDVIGCGVNFRTGAAFFTKNGIFLGNAFHNIRSDRLYPSVGIKKPGEHLRINFGQSDFMFDIDTMVENERRFVRTDINKAHVSDSEAPSTSDETRMVQELIQQYLSHEGYVDTAKQFALDVHEQRRSLYHDEHATSTPDPLDDLNAINRQKIRAAILAGDIDKAFKFLGAFYSHVLERDENRDVYFRLRCRKFIEMIRRSYEVQSGRPMSPEGHPLNGSADVHGTAADRYNQQMELDDQLQRDSRLPKAEAATEAMDTTSDTTRSITMQHNDLLTAAIQYGMELQAEFSGDPRIEVKKALSDTFALIAYTDARESVLAEMVQGKGRVEIAEQVNGAILVSLGKPRSALLEKVCAQTEVLVDMLSGTGGAAPFVNVQRDYLQ